MDATYLYCCQLSFQNHVYLLSVHVVQHHGHHNTLSIMEMDLIQSKF